MLTTFASIPNRSRYEDDYPATDPFLRAVHQGADIITRYMVRHGADVHAVGSDGETAQNGGERPCNAAYLPAVFGSGDTVWAAEVLELYGGTADSKLTAAAADCPAGLGYGATFLQQAVLAQDVPMVKLLLEHGAQVNATEDVWDTRREDQSRNCDDNGDVPGGDWGVAEQRYYFRLRGEDKSEGKREDMNQDGSEGRPGAGGRGRPDLAAVAAGLELVPYTLDQADQLELVSADKMATAASVALGVGNEEIIGILREAGADFADVASRPTTPFRCTFGVAVRLVGYQYYRG